MQHIEIDIDLCVGVPIRNLPSFLLLMEEMMEVSCTLWETIDVTKKLAHICF